MGVRTSGVRSVKLRGPIQGPPSSLQNVDLNQINAQIGIGATTVNNPEDIDYAGFKGVGDLTPRPIQEQIYSSGVVNQEPINLEGEQKFAGNRTPGISTPEFDTAKVTSPADLFADASSYEKEKLRLQELGAKLDITQGVLQAVGGVINAQAKYSQTINAINFNKQMAEIQAYQVVSNAQQKMLKEQTKGIARGQEAQIAAVAQGQSASGDLARTQMSNEEVYAAENMMNIEINSMRQVFGLESNERLLDSRARMAGISRDLEMAQSISSGLIQAGSGFASAPKGTFTIPGEV